MNCNKKSWSVLGLLTWKMNDKKKGFKKGEKFAKITLNKHSKTSFEKNCFFAWASTLNMGLINKVDMVCLSPVGYGV